MVKSAAVDSCCMSRSYNVEGHMHNVSVTQHVTNFSYCDICGNMVVEKCEHCFNNCIVIVS